MSPPSALQVSWGKQQEPLLIQGLPGNGWVQVMIVDPLAMGCRCGPDGDAFAQGIVRRRAEQTGQSFETLVRQMQEQTCPFLHLLLCNLPYSEATLSLPLESLRENSATLLPNSYGERRYHPPAPPDGDPIVHEYDVDVWWTPEQIKVPHVLPQAGALVESFRRACEVKGAVYGRTKLLVRAKPA